MKPTARRNRARSEAESLLRYEDVVAQIADRRQQQIATSAYFKAEARGFAPGLEMADWLQAETEFDTGAGEA